ncbi:MAPEG family protein [Undibacterium fentianense]|uniref:MAPEG family protein n=1 Tax=Undibacterium fentianense TaxID=2828728 RepID=A0A941IE03_9BURK|nr:MAPEG family protein [Undibacterium fentianense]MBR7800553.1 MAPEG family protein [Undibacterium fentianense]
MSQTLLLPMTAHVLLAALLYGLLTLVRAPKVWGIGARQDGSNPWAMYEPKISANLSNQFEWPLFFHIACLIFMMTTTNNPYDTVVSVLAWLFIIGRILHSMIQIGTNNIRLRGLVFTINFLAVMGLWGMLFFARMP